MMRVCAVRGGEEGAPFGRAPIFVACQEYRNSAGDDYLISPLSPLPTLATFLIFPLASLTAAGSSPDGQVDFALENPRGSSINVVDCVSLLVNMGDFLTFNRIYMGAYNGLTQKPLKIFTTAAFKQLPGALAPPRPSYNFTVNPKYMWAGHGGSVTSSVIRKQLSNAHSRSPVSAGYSDRVGRFPRLT
jgi:hypothetical protein